MDQAEGFDSDESFESNANYSFEEKYDDIIELEISLPQEELTMPEGEEDNIIATATSFFLAKFKPDNCQDNWFQKEGAPSMQ